MFRDAPTGAWACVLLIWLRTAALAAAIWLFAVGIDTACDLSDQHGVSSLLKIDLTAAGPQWLVAAGCVLVAAGAAALAEYLPARIQAEEEAHWRRSIMSVAARLLDSSGRGAGHSGGRGIRDGAQRAAAQHPGEQTLHSSGHGGGTPRHGAGGHGYGGSKPAARPVTEGGIVDAATGAAEKTALYRAQFLAPTFASFSAPVLVIAAWALAVHPIGAVVLAAFVALVPLGITLAGKWLRTSNAEYRRKEAAATEQYLEMIEGIGTLKVLDAAERTRDKFAVAARASMRELGRLLIQNQRMIVVNDAVFGVLLGAAAIGIAMVQLGAGQITFGQAIAACLLTVLLQEPIDRLGRSFYIGLAGRARRDQLVGMLERARTESVSETADSGTTEGAATAPATTGIAPNTNSAPRISVHNLDVSMGSERILKQLGCVIPDGKRTVIVGPSGSGKSTLMRCIAGLDQADGRIRFNGERVSAHARRAASTRMGQDAAIVTGTVRDNLRLAAPDASDDELIAVLSRARFPGVMDATASETLDRTVGDRGTALSGGERRRLMFARVLLRDRPVLLLDEATADLDRSTERQLREALREFGHGKTVVEIAHRIDTTVDADRILVLEDGHITATGTPEQLRATPGFYADALAAIGEIASLEHTTAAGEPALPAESAPPADSVLPETSVQHSTEDQEANNA